ncbi:entericidin A/B family lipoprotein [uncultured Sphingomonas sp.]|nr:entericidin A/B family lipoprotein [uncultured Sphingomonas sp.]
MNRKIAVATSLAILFGLSACNTVNGAGKDLKSAGDAISGASGESKK